MTGPIPAPDSQGPQLTSPPWGELSAARILASTVVAILQKFCSNSGSALGFSFIVNSSHGSGTVLSGSEAYFRNAGNPHLGVSEETVLALLSDQNQDLTFFAALEPKRGNVTDPRHAARTELTHL